MMLHKNLKTKRHINLFQWIVDISTVVALILQCLDFPDPWNKFIPYIALLVIFLFIISIIINIVSKKSVYLRSELVQLTKDRMINSTGKIVLFGGDLSWTDDYVDTITAITDNNQVVEIFFPLETIANAKRSVISRFEKRVCKLKKAGATIFSTIEDYHLRCTLIDVDSGHENEDLCVISCKRVYKNPSNAAANKYQVDVLENANEAERAMCNSFYRNYCLIKALSSEY